jgi:hypothetical protein
MAGSLVQTHHLTTHERLKVHVVTLAFTADSSGNFTSTAIAQWIMDKIQGSYLFRIKTFPTPSGTAPTGSWGFTLTDDDGLDVLGGVGASQSHSAVVVSVPRQDSNQALFGPVLVGENNGATLTLGLTGVGNNANGTIRLLLSA